MTLTAMGMTSGIGSLLIGAREAGFKVLGNIEWRRYYRATDEHGRNTFTENFPGAFLTRTVTPEIVEKYRGKIDLMMGHPECGPYSVLSGANYRGRKAEEYAATASDIPVFIQGVAELRPRFFVMDNLPRSLVGCPMSVWASSLPGYHLFPEWVSNYHYGNVQKNRKRFFMIGALKDEKYVFMPNEMEHSTTLEDVLKGLTADIPNHDPHVLDESTCRGRGIVGPGYMTFREARDFFRTYEAGKNLPYVSRDGTQKQHIGLLKTYKTYCHVLHGGWPTYNPWTCLPFSIRERARIQGIPDSFVFYGTVLNDDGTWNHNKNAAMIKQTGKCMPVQFAKYVSHHIADHIQCGPDRYAMGGRCVKPNRFVDAAKQWYCAYRHDGQVYGPWQDAQQLSACTVCGVAECKEAIR